MTFRRSTIRIRPATTASWRQRRSELKIAAWVGGFVGLMLAGCTVGPNYTPPDTKLASSYASAATAKKTETGRLVPEAEAPGRWWAVFEDPELNSLINRALNGNRDIKEALSRLRQARAERAAIGSRLLPEIDVNGGYNRGHGSQNVTLPFGAASNSSSTPSGKSTELRGESDGANSGGGGDALAGAASSGGSTRPAGPTSPLGEGGLPGITTNLYQVGFDATWELDFFGASRRALEAANASVEAAQEGGRAIMVSLLAEVAETYIQLRGVQRQRALAEANVATARDLVAVARARREAGLGADLDVVRQEAETRSFEATLPALAATERKMAHTLAFLVGEEPATLVDELSRPADLPEMPPRVPIGVPSDLLRRRPDVRQAERELAAATAGVGVATAQLFPTFSLTGTAGLDSSDVRHLPDWASHYYSITPGIRWPILDWGRVRAGIRVQDELQNQAFLRYQTRVAQALKEVEDALVQFESEQDRRAALAGALDASRDAWSLARQQFEQGVVDETVTLDAHRAELQVETNLAQSDAALRTDLIALYKALGGGWQL